MSGGLSFDYSPEQRMLYDMIHAFVDKECGKPLARKLEAQDAFPRALFERIGAAGLYGIGIPEEYGGQGGGIEEQVIVCTEFARTLAGLSVLWHLTCWSGAKAILHHGTEDQRRHYLPRIARGELLFALAMTEPDGGTDVLRAMKTRAVPVDGGFRITGRKIWSTLAHEADKLLVLVRSETGDRPSQGLSVVIVDARAEGVTATPIPKLGLRCLGSCEVTFDNVFVPADAMIGAPGSGWRQITASLNAERILTAAMCTGMIEGVLEDALDYAGQRKAFGQLIGGFQAVQHKIADIAMNLETARLHTRRAAWLEARGRPCMVEATMAKCLAAELATAAADEGIQILGGMGYSAETDMQRYWRDARLFRIGPITSEMARNTIGESLGLPRSF